MLSLEEVKNVYRESNQKKKKKSEPKPKPQQRYQPKYDRSSKSTHRSRQPASYKPYVSKGVQEQKKKGYNETAGGRFTQGVIRNGFMAGFPSETKATYTDSKDKTRKVSESKAYKAGKVVGDFMSYGTGYGLAGKAIARATGKAVAKKAAKEVGEKVAKETTEKAVKKTAQKTAGKLAKAEDKVATKAGDKILKANEKLGNKIAKSKAVQKYAEKKASKASEVAKIAGTAKRKEAIAKDVGAKAADKITKSLIADATAGTVLDTARAKGEGMDIGLNKEYAKYMGTNALLNVGMGAGMEGLGAGAKAVARSQAAKKGAQTVRKLVNGKQKDVKIKNDTHVPSTLKGKESAEKVGKIQKDFTEMPTVPKGQKMKDALSPEEIRQRRNVQNRYSEVTKESRARQEARGDYNRSLKKKGVQEERVRQVKDIAPEMPKSADDYVARINTARKYADDNNINFSDVVKEHNGNRAEAINDLVARAEESKPVRTEEPNAEVKNANDAKQTGATEPNKATLDKDEIVASAEGNSKSALDDIENERDFETWSDYGSEEGAKHVDDALEWMEKNGLDSEDSALYDEVLARMYLNEKRGMSPETTVETPRVEEPSTTVNAETATQPKAEQPKEQNLGEFKSAERPKQYARDSGDVSQVADTVKRSNAVDDEYRQHISERIEDGLLDMRHMKNSDAVAKAEAKVGERGAENVAKSFIDNVDDGFQMTGERVAEAYVCAKELIKNGDYKTADALIERLTIAESENARSVQAMRLFASLTPEGKVSSVLRMLRTINKQHNTNVKVPDELLDALRNAKTQKEINEAKEAISLHIWNNIPPNWVEKVNAWRYLSMLGNPKTHVRNLIGNVIFSPVKTFRNILATGLEHALVKDTSARTKAVLNPLSKSDRNLKRLAKDSWDSGIGDVLSSGSKYIDGGSMNDIMRRNPNARVFLFPLLDKAYKANGWLLNKEDSLFMKPHYESAYAQYLKARGYTVENATEEILKKAERYASEEALNSTYRDFSVLADKLNKFKRYSNTKLKDIPSNYDTEGARAADRLVKKTSSIAVEALVPFTKTPINILRRGIEYSPANVIGGCVKIGKALAKNDMDGLVKGIANLSAGTSGSAAFALGLYMSKQGLATGGIDFTNKEEKYNNMLGDQQYSIKVTKDFPFNTSGKDYSFTVDSFAPISIPFFMGVELGDGFDGVSGADLLSMADKITDPVFNLSMLSSLKNAFDNQYSSGNSVAEVARKTGESYAGQFIPTILGQTARTFQDEITGSTATDEDPNIRAYRTFANQMKNKIPKLADTNAPVVNDWGEKQTNDNRLIAALQNYVNPLNVKEVKEDDVDLELRTLMDQGADNSVLPSSRPQGYTVNYNDEELRMSPKEFMKMKENTGTESKKKLRELFSTPAYQKGSVEEKQKMIKEVYTNAKNYAKRQMLADRGYTKEDISWNLDLSEKDREKFGTSGKFLKMLKKTGVTPSEFSEMKAEGLSVSDLRAAAEQKMSLKDYHIVKEVQDEYKGGYGAQAAVLHENGLLNLEMFDAAKKDGKSMVYGIKKNTYKVASAYSDAGYSADEIQDMIGDVEEIAEDIKQNYGSRTYSNGVVHVTPEGVQAYLDQRDDLSQQDKHNLWYIYGEGQPWFMKRNPY